MPISPVSEADSYVAKWIARTPALELALLFCPPSQRRPASLWGALCHELDESVFDLSDAGVAQTKLAWWGEELERGSRGEGRHPLVRAWFELPTARSVPAQAWVTVAHAGLRLVADERSPADSAASVARVQDYAGELSRIESLLFGRPTPPEAVAIERLVAHRLRDSAPARLPWPLHLRARHQLPPGDEAPAALRRDYARDLLPLLQPHGSGWVLRRCITALTLQRARALADGGDASRQGHWRNLWTIWRAARSA